MTRTLLLLAAFVVPAPVAAQVGAPLIDGLGGPFDVGQPHDGGPDVPLAPALPDGIRYYGDRTDDVIRVNWQGSLSFGGFDDRGAGPIPGRFNALGRGLRRIVPFQHSSELTQYDELVNDPPWPTYVAQIPAGEDGTPGRFVATWYEVTDRPPEPGTLRNTWQAILTGPDPNDYTVEFRYHRCAWLYGHLREDEPAAMGFDGGEGPDGPGWMWSGSLSDDALLLCRLSNVREPGVFRYRIVDGLPTGCGIDPMPPPGEGRCADGNHLPGDGCSPACYVEADVDGDGRYEAPHPDSVDPNGVYDDCFDPEDPLCDDDTDDDRVPDIVDNCPEHPNPDQKDYDGDWRGNACDIDADGDNLFFPHDPDNPLSILDLCPLRDSNGDRQLDESQRRIAWQYDLDRDGIGDPCDDDDDGDGVLDCGGDGICDPEDDGYNNDRDFYVDEAGECAGESCPEGDTDNIDNDEDGYVDEIDGEYRMPSVKWPGPDAPPALPEDNCRRIHNPAQADLDRDGIGDACDIDMDGDGIANCAGDGICGPQGDARDNDFDGAIDEAGECAMGCDPAADRVDQDLDGFVDEDFEVEQALRDGAELPPPLDNCPRVATADQSDWDGDGIGDACDDSDGDGTLDAADNCREAANEDQRDLDGDGIGDVCDTDRDGDGIDDVGDRCPDDPDDGSDLDLDGVPDACDPDVDGDGVVNGPDICPRNADPDQDDADQDGKGDACDDDIDGDGTLNDTDVCPREADDQTDTDRDGQGDACDEDDDGDGVSDEDDGCDLIADPDQADLDGDGMGDACDDTDDRPFDALSPAEKCARLVRDRAPTAERVRHCPPPADDSCRVGLGSSGDTPWWLLVLVGLARRRRAFSPPPASGGPGR